MRSNGLRCVIFIVGSLVASSARAQPDRTDGYKRAGPPPEMVEACNGSAAGDACTVTLKGQAMNGTCRAGPTQEAPLACFPKGPPPGIGAALEACKGRAAGDSCTVVFSDHAIEGTCGADPHRDGSLICVPANAQRM
jgi:hypothetical protein